MSSTKIVIIVLVVIVVLFVVLVIWGAGNNSGQSSSAASFNSTNYPFLNSLSGLGNSPKFDVKQLQPQLKTFDLARQAKYQVKVLADSDNSFRRAAIKVQPDSNPSCAQVIFTPEPMDGLSDDLKKPQSSDAVKKPNDFTLSIPKGGGELVVETKSPNKPCTVTLN